MYWKGYSKGWYRNIGTQIHWKLSLSSSARRFLRDQHNPLEILGKLWDKFAKLLETLLQVTSHRHPHSPLAISAPSLPCPKIRGRYFSLTLTWALPQVVPCQFFQSESPFLHVQHYKATTSPTPLSHSSKHTSSRGLPWSWAQPVLGGWQTVPGTAGFPRILWSVPELFATSFDLHPLSPFVCLIH